MPFSKQINAFKYIDYCMRKRTKGKVAEIAQILGISERQVFNYIRIMRDEGAPIFYCRKTHRYYYSTNGHFQIGFQIEETGRL